MSPSHPSRCARLSRGRPSPAACSLIRSVSERCRSRYFSSASRRAVSGSPRMSSAPARSRSKARNAVGCRRSSMSMSRSPLTWMRPCSCWNPAGRPLASSATISPSMRSGARSARASGSSARTTAGNCEVFSLPSRDQRRMSGRGLPGATWTSARMPSYLGSKSRFFPVSGGSDNVASIGRTFEGSSVQRGISWMIVRVNSQLPPRFRLRRNSQGEPLEPSGRKAPQQVGPDIFHPEGTSSSWELGVGGWDCRNVQP